MSSFPVPDSARRAAVRARMLAAVSCLASATALLASLSACGGGGSDAPTPVPPSPTPVPSPAPATPIAAQMSVPTPVGYDAERLAAFNRLNEIRLSAGLGMVAQNALLDQAAQAHADWMIANDAFVHEEAPGSTGFTGAHFWDRAEALGYLPVGGDEVMSSGASASAGVDALVNTLYHRVGMLAFEPVDVGIGRSDATIGDVRTPLVMDMTRPGTDEVRGLGQAAQPGIQGVAIWPLDGAISVPTRLGIESPNPIPGHDVSTLGTPVTLNVDRLQTIQVSSFVMTNVATGGTVPSRVVTSQSDLNQLIPHSFVGLVPLLPLDPNVSYHVAFSGQSIAFPSASAVDIRRDWTFTTGTH